MRRNHLPFVVVLPSCALRSELLSKHLHFPGLGAVTAKALSIGYSSSPSVVPVTALRRLFRSSLPSGCEFFPRSQSLGSGADLSSTFIKPRNCVTDKGGQYINYRGGRRHAVIPGLSCGVSALCQQIFREFCFRACKLRCNVL